MRLELRRLEHWRSWGGIAARPVPTTQHIRGIGGILDGYAQTTVLPRAVDARIGCNASTACSNVSPIRREETSLQDEPTFRQQLSRYHYMIGRFFTTFSFTVTKYHAGAGPLDPMQE